MSTLTSCPDKDALRHFSLGYVRESEAAGLESHLAECPGCIETLHDIQSEDTLVDAIRAQSTLERRPVDATVIQLMVEFKRWNPTAPLQNKESPSLIEADNTRELVNSLAPPERSDELGRLGSYRIIGVLGSGGMGVVFEAEDLQLLRPVALKALSQPLAQSSTARKRFLREARAAAVVAHDNVVTIYQVGEDRGIPFLAMQYLEGETLEARLQREGSLPLGEILRLGIQLADGLGAAHAQSLLHRDIKPANIWLDNSSPGSSRVKLLDFGLAWSADDNGPITEIGTIVGTPAYMAPEQARGELADVRSDLFSMGSVLYAMCTGQAPFQEQSKFATLEKVRAGFPRSIREINPAISASLAAIVEKLHAKDPADRCQSAAEVAALLREAASARHAAIPESAPLAPQRVIEVKNPQARVVARSRWWNSVAMIFISAVVALSLCEANGLTHLRHIISDWREQSDDSKIAANGKTDVLRKSADIAHTPSPVSNDRQGEPMAPPAQEKTGIAFPTALFPFEERGAGVHDFGAKVTDILFARLASHPEMCLVDRSDLKKILGELELNISGVVNATEANKVGQLTGAKLFVSGSISRIDKKIYLIAKIVSTETSRVLAVSVDGGFDDELAALVEKLAHLVGETISRQGDTLVAKTPARIDRVAALNAKIKGKRPAVLIRINERHLGADAMGSAAQSEFARFCKETGFTPIDAEFGLKSAADVMIIGEAFTELAARHGNLVSVKARVEIKAIDRKTDAILAIDRQTALVVDLAEQNAAKAALEEAAAILAERILPKLVRD